MGRMHGDAQFAGSSSVPAHVEMMGLIGMGNNPMVGATVACAVAVEEALAKSYLPALIKGSVFTGPFVFGFCFGCCCTSVLLRKTFCEKTRFPACGKCRPRF